MKISDAEHISCEFVHRNGAWGLEGMGYEILQRISDMKCESELLRGVMDHFILRALLN